MSKKTTLTRFLYGLGIRDVGITTAANLTQHFQNLTALMNADEESLRAIPDIGPIVATHIKIFFSEPHNLAIIKNLLTAGIVWPKPTVINQQNPSPLMGKTFVLTGGLSTLSREQATTLLQEQGAKVTSNLTKKTDYVIVGKEPGSKLNRAQQLGLPILMENEFIKLLKKANLS